MKVKCSSSSESPLVILEMISLHIVGSILGLESCNYLDFQKQLFLYTDSRLWDQEPHRLAMAAHVWKFTFWKCIGEHILPSSTSAYHDLSNLDKPFFLGFSKNIKKRIIPCLSATKYSNVGDNGLCT